MKLYYSGNLYTKARLYLKNKLKQTKNFYSKKLLFDKNSF